MPKVQSFKLHPLAITLKLLSITPFLLVGEMTHARVLNPGEVLTIDGSTAPDNYVLNGASTLNANGAQTRDITVNNSTLNLNGSTVQATGSALGVAVNSSVANIALSTISSNQAGLSVVRNAAAIVVDTLNVGPTQVNIAVLNGSTLNGSNGILMDGPELQSA